MNTDTGKIFDEEEIEKKFGGFAELPDNFMEIMQSDLTKKQADNKQVSLKDHQSKAGKILTNARKGQSK